MESPNIIVLEFQKRTSHTEFLRWSKMHEDAVKEFEELPEGDPKQTYLSRYIQECRLLSEHYNNERAAQESLIASLRELT